MKIKRLSVVDEVFKVLQEGIIRGKYKVNECLPSQDKLAVIMGVSRPVVREAINRLAVHGYVEPRQGVGTMVLHYKGDETILETSRTQDITPREIMDLAFARIAIETLIARFAAVKATPDDMARLRNNLEQQRRHLNDTDTMAYVNIDVEFHLLLSEIAKNSILHAVLTSNLKIYHKYMASILSIAFSPKRSYSHHCGIYEAIVERNPDKAEYEVRHHIETTLIRIPDNIIENQQSLIDVALGDFDKGEV